MDPRVMQQKASNEDAFQVPGFEYFGSDEPYPEAAVRNLFDNLEQDWVGGDYDFGKPMKRQTKDIVNKPSHYTRWAIEPITFIMRNGFEFWRGNIIKYASRAGFKQYPDMDMVQSEITDLQKVKRYCDMRINQLRGETSL